MAVAWGNFDDMALYYLKCIGYKSLDGVIMFCKTLEPVYAVGTYAEYKECVELSGQGMYRPVIAMSADEFIGILLARFPDIVEVATDAVEEENIQTGKQPGAEHTDLDARGDRTETGRHSENNGGGEKEDNCGTVH